MRGEFGLLGDRVTRVVKEAAHDLVDIAADNEIKQIAHRYGITPVFAGVFGSRAKVYDGPESDYDLYVPYIGKMDQYVKALDVDTRQIEGKEILPAQVTVQVINRGKTFDVQLNFVSLDHYLRELTRCNIDFRIALDNILVSYCQESVRLSLLAAAQTYVDPEKIRSMCLGRADKTATSLKTGKAISRSEITDGLYRLLYAAMTTNDTAWRHLYFNHTPSMAQLLDSYLTYFGDDQATRTTVEALLTTIRCGKWKDGEPDDVIVAAIIATIYRVIPQIRKRPVKVSGDFEKSTITGVEARLDMASKLNKMFIELVIKAHTERTLT